MKEQNAKQNTKKKIKKERKKKRQQQQRTCTHHAALATANTQHIAREKNSDTEPPIPLESVPFHILNEANVDFFFILLLHDRANFPKS